MRLMRKSPKEILEITPQPKQSIWSRLTFWFTAFVTLMFLISIALGPTHSIKMAAESAAMQTCRTIALAMFSYAEDHGSYPDGNNSTEVFQKLLDGNYLSDPDVFYSTLTPGKAPAHGAKLKPENVSYDVTLGVTKDSPDHLPIVFLTGFRMEYRAGGTTIWLPDSRPVGWFEWICGRRQSATTDGLPIGYQDNSAFFKLARPHGQAFQYTADGHIIIPDIVPTDFDARGHTYRQLTPDGELK